VPGLAEPALAAFRHIGMYIPIHWYIPIYQCFWPFKKASEAGTLSSINTMSIENIKHPPTQHGFSSKPQTLGHSFPRWHTLAKYLPHPAVHSANKPL